MEKGIPDTVTIVKQEDYEKALLMSEAVREHPQAKCLFRHYTAEQPIYWMRDGIECKAKPDIVSTVFGQRFCADLKTTESANPEAIQRTIAKYGYHRQAAWYLDGMKAIGQPCEAFIFIFVEKHSRTSSPCASSTRMPCKRGYPSVCPLSKASSVA